MSVSKSKPGDEPEARDATLRGAIRAALRDEELTAREVSARVGVAERDVAEHLSHLAQSLEHSGEQLQIIPPCCVKCGFSFEERTRHNKPSRCPRCRSERISPARFRVVTLDV